MFLFYMIRIFIRELQMVFAVDLTIIYNRIT